MRLHKSYDMPGLCGTKTETETLQEALDNNLTIPQTTSEERQIQSLRDQMLLRVLANASNRGQHPLHAPQIAFVTLDGFSKLDDTTRNSPHKVTYSWSFTQNIVRPLEIVHRLRLSAGEDPFVNLRNTDGWVLNVLVTKIKAAMRVTRVPEDPTTTFTTPDSLPHFTKRYNEKGDLVSQHLAGEPCPAGLTARPDAQSKFLKEVGNVRVGRLDPILDMIPIADPAKGEKPNVRVERKEGVKVFALSEGECGVVLYEGDVLLRAAGDVLSDLI